MEKVKLGIIGCGSMANQHSKGYDHLKDRLEVAATCDVLLERAEKAAAHYGAEFVCTDYREMLDRVDAVLIVLPHDLHYEVSMACMQAGKHVLVEKPMANTEQQCIDMIEMSEKTGKILMTAYPVRYHPMVVKMKELLDNKTYGDVFQVSIFTEQLTKYYEGHWALNAKRLGGGQFFSHGCHYVDILLWMLGRPVRGAHIGTNYGTPWMEKEGTSNMTIEFESGALGMHFGTWGARGTRLGAAFHAHCTGGMLEINVKEHRLYFHGKMEEERSEIKTSQSHVLMEVPSSKYSHHEINHFIDCIQYGKKPETDGPESLQGLRVIWRLYEAERQNTMADLRGLGLKDDWRKVKADHVSPVCYLRAK